MARIPWVGLSFMTNEAGRLCGCLLDPEMLEADFRISSRVHTVAQADTQTQGYGSVSRYEWKIDGSHLGMLQRELLLGQA